MSRLYSISDIKFIKPATLYKWITTCHSPNGTFQVIDVRDSDYVGGHIRGSWNYPASDLNGSKILELQQRIYDAKIKDVVFHCMLSQARGPKSALKFLRSLDDIVDPEMQRYFQQDDVRVYILKGGFTEWAGEYGPNSEVTEDFAEDIWGFGS